MRKAMIDSQLRTSGVHEDFVLARMGSVPREEFVPEAARSIAYMDRAIPLGEGRFLPAPLVHGKMLGEAAPTSADRVLVVDGGSGYLAELIRPLVAKLDNVDADEIAAKAGKRGSYSLILVDGAVEQLPDALGKYLEEDGRIVTGLVVRGVTRLASGRKIAGTVSLQPLADIGIPVLHQFDKPKEWSF
ncbi:protein-L-isoaspartate O-methyltransferase [Altererythrobacter arenosus]|uniref:Protein-L-isoaspartate O-methyltransferase n=1 Tax=Altererythrobacter arenosus TaxID=3032592 RepID=A0ABY8FX50_9SPHN|nr:protein-L-isoaspartate O-methyltransferase [Altererythrobacter sp. CAU 1644]WFL78635.1 protein-L-isoaspartate O-methyltransferase [Altererythrobacter sp. CAU 1644]